MDEFKSIKEFIKKEFEYIIYNNTHVKHKTKQNKTKIERIEKDSMAPSGTVIIPPPELRTIIDKTANFVARNGAEFEQKIAEQKRDSAQFGFLMPANPYHAYYRKMVHQESVQDMDESDDDEDESEIMEDDTHQQQQQQLQQLQQEQQTQVIEKKADVVTTKREKLEHDPWPYTYGIPLPKGITPLEIDVIKLTAQFAALNGAPFVSALHGRESRNPQFDFMKVTHMYFNFYNGLTNMYRVLIAAGEVYHRQMMQAQQAGNGSSDDHQNEVEEKEEEKHTGHELIEQLKFQADQKKKLKILDRVYSKAEWETMQEEKRRKEQSELEEEQTAMAMIDWYDFVVVETIDFARDELLQPAATDDIAAQQPQQPATPAVAPPPPPPPPAAAAAAVPPSKPAVSHDEDDMEVDEVRPTDMNKKKIHTVAEEKDQEQVDSEDELANVRIRRNYKRQVAPPAKTTSTAQSNVVVDPITGEVIPMEKAQEHLRVQLLNPRWREQKARELKKHETTNIASADDIAANLMAFASRRAGSKKEETTQIDDRLIWDGHTASISQTAAAATQLQHLRAQHMQQHEQQQPAKPMYGPQIPHGEEVTESVQEYHHAGTLPPAKRQRTDGTNAPGTS